MRDDFDQDYYDRFYENPRTCAVDEAEAERQAAFIAAYLSYLEVPVQRIADIGCGLGRVLRALGARYPQAKTTGVEYSSYVCERHGWTQGSVVDFQSAKPFDLVVCNDVIAYLDDRSCARAINNLSRLTRSALFLGVLTKEDWRLCDTERTDDQQYLRPKAWYAKRLDKHFVNVGGGIYLKKPLAFPVWTMDRLN
ncbi:MAG: class I SAM-dependent methyltransferase [Pseudomonadota bacterium]